MTSKTNFFVVSLIAIMAAGPAFSATTATQEWTKNRYDSKISTINVRLAQNVRDMVYDYDKTKDNGIANPLRTDGQNAFDGINEVLQKVNGNDGTLGSSVQLETTAKNAFGAINELKGEIDNLDVPTKVSDLTNDSNYVTANDLNDYALSEDVPTKVSDLTNDSNYVTTNDLNDYALSEDVPTKVSDLTNDSNYVTANDLNDYALSEDVPTKVSDLTNDSGYLSAPQVQGDANKTFIYNSKTGWKEIEVKDEFPGNLAMGG